jgi:hypothetical protein
MGESIMKHIHAFILAAITILAPIQAALTTAGCLVMLDLILGIIAAKKRGAPITSAGLRRTVSKMVIFQIAIITGFLTEKYLTGDLVPVCKIITAFIGLTEIKSIVENLNAINGNSIFSDLITKLGSKNDDIK